MRDLLAHTVPYFLYVAIGAALSGVCPWSDAVRIMACGAILAWCLRAGKYRELTEKPVGWHLLAGTAVGAAVGVAWVPMAKLVPAMGETARTGLDPAKSLLESSFRIVDMVVLAPLVEELLVRSAIPRIVDAGAGRDWRALNVGTVTWLGGAASVVFFTLTHPEWLAALVTGIAWMLLLRMTRNLWVVIVSHAVANAWLAHYVLATGEKQWW